MQCRRIGKRAQRMGGGAPFTLYFGDHPVSVRLYSNPNSIFRPITNRSSHTKGQQLHFYTSHPIPGSHTYYTECFCCPCLTAKKSCHLCTSVRCICFVPTGRLVCRGTSILRLRPEGDALLPTLTLCMQRSGVADCANAFGGARNERRAREGGSRRREEEIEEEE